MFRSLWRTPTLRNRILYATTVAVLWAAAETHGNPSVPIQIGTSVGKVQLQDVTGNIYSLQSYSGKIVILFFWSFKCPVSLAYGNRMEALQEKYGNRGVAVLAVASGANETPQEIRANTRYLNITVPVLLDAEGELAEKFGATHTPSVFLLDRKTVLRYRGAPDNNKSPEDKGRAAYIDEAIDALLDGRPVSVPETKPFGCNINRRRFNE
jgi:peroxiredoxin